MEKHCCEVCILEFAKKGFKFDPSAQEICETYLKLKIEGKKLPCKHLIFDENMYEHHSTPWELFKSDDPRWVISTTSTNNKTKKVMYVFTKLKKKGERVLRRAGCGTWTGQNKKEVRNEGGDAIIGYDKLLTFKVSSEEKMNGNWTMHEFSLHPKDYSVAVCKITKEEEVIVLDKSPPANDNVALENMYQEGLVQVQPLPLLEQEWESFAETLEDIILLQPEGLGEACNENINVGSDPFQVKIDNGTVANEDMTNVIAQPQGICTEDLVQAQAPPLEQEWESFAETLEDIILQQPEGLGEACNENIHIGSDQLPVQINDATLANESMTNVIAQPQGMEDTLASDPVSELFKDYEPPRDMQCQVPDEDSRQVLVAEQPQQSERMALMFHLAENFDYYYKEQQQQQQLEGGLNNFKQQRKRKNCNYQEEELGSRKKQQHQPFLCSPQ